MIQLNNLSKSYGVRVLFKNVTLFINEKERIGLVGRNGSGKSTIFKIILGQETADEGEVIAPKGYKIGSLSQHISFTKSTVLEECSQHLKGEEQFDFYKAEKILFGLGFSEEDLNKDPYSFSGGYQIRINLCKALLDRPNLLLLDEPTNYLDIVSLRWLKSFLNNFQGEVIIITHDRDFMDSVTTHTMGISRKTLKKIKGSTQKYYEQIKEEEEIHEQTRVNQERKKKEMMDNIDRFRSKAGRATQAQSKLKQVNKMEVLDKLSDESSLDFSFHYKKCPAKVLLEVEDLSFGFDENNILFKDLKFSINRNDRIGIIGKNGKGKSTLLNVLSGNLKELSGKIRFHPGVEVGHFGQTNVERLHPKNTIYQEILDSNTNLTHTDVRKIAGTMMFSGDDADKKIEVLSGGERARVMLGKILAKPCNFLFLDEPTNHLDIESVDSLTEEIKKFEGACLLVTHSERLLKKICNRLIIFHEGGAEYFYGNYEDFLEKIGWDSEEVVDRIPKTNKISRKEYKHQRSELIKERSKKCSPLKKQIELHEKWIGDLERELEKKNKEIEEKTAQGDNAAITNLSMEIGQIHIKIEDHFTKLEELTEEHDNAYNSFEEKLNELDKLH